jgi:hypothetical protein
LSIVIVWSPMTVGLPAALMTRKATSCVPLLVLVVFQLIVPETLVGQAANSW